MARKLESPFQTNVKGLRKISEMTLRGKSLFYCDGVGYCLKTNIVEQLYLFSSAPARAHSGR